MPRFAMETGCDGVQHPDAQCASRKRHHVQQDVDFHVQPIGLLLPESLYPIRRQLTVAQAAANQRAGQTGRHARVPTIHHQVCDRLSGNKKVQVEIERKTK